jgi:hypothetical protein
VVKSCLYPTRLIQTTAGYTGYAGQRVMLTGEFTVKPGAVLYLRMTIPGQKTRCKRIVKPTLTRLERFTCASTAGVSFTSIRVKISSMGGGQVQADNVRIEVQ